MPRRAVRRPVWVGVATFVVLFVAWYALTSLTHAIGPGRFPSPAESWDALRQISLTGYADAKLHEHVLHSVKLVLLGFIAAIAIGVPLGLAMGWNRSFEAFVPAVINSYSGVRAIEPHLLEAARMLGVPRRMLVREVLIPVALPMIFTGLRLSMQACWTTLAAGELIGAIAGLGHVLYQASLDLFPAMIVVGMAAVAVTGATMTALIGWIEKRAMPWRRHV